MARLVADAAILDSSVDASSMSFDNVTRAIHAVQTEMGITGTTSLEASSTISGSVSSMQSAWQNLLVGVADDNADFGLLVDNFVETVGTVAQNILPRIQEALNGAGDLVNELVPVIIDMIPQIITDTLPNMLQSGVDIILSIMQGLTDNQQAILDGTLDAVLLMIDTITENLPKLIEMGVTLISNLAVGLVNAIPDIVAKIPEIVKSVVKAFKDNKETFKTAGKDMLKAVGDGISNMVETAKGWGKDLIDNFTAGIKEKWNHLKDTVGQTAEKIKKYLGFSEPEEGPLSNFHTYAPDMMDVFAKGIKDNERKVTDQIGKSFNFGEQTIQSSMGCIPTSQSVKIGFDDTVNGMGLARYLLPLLKIAEKEVFA